MKSRRVAAYASAAVVVAAVCIALAMMRGGNEPSADAGEGVAPSRSINDAGARSRSNGTFRQPAKREKPEDGAKTAGGMAKDTVVVADEEYLDEEKPLTERQKGVRNELQAALDDNDLMAVRRAIAKFNASPAEGGLGGDITKGMRRQAVQALAWFGKEGVIDLIGFLGDEDESIASEACDQFELAMNSGDMSQAESSMYLKAIMTALTDPERIDNLLANLAPMDNAVRADTIREILANGTAEAKEVMREKLEFYTDVGVKGVEDLEKWALKIPYGE